MANHAGSESAWRQLAGCSRLLAMSEHYEVYAIRYAECSTRTRGESFIFDTSHDVPHALDYFVLVKMAHRHALGSPTVCS